MTAGGWGGAPDDDDPVVVDPDLRSWVDGARDSGYPLQHLPYGVVAPRDGPPRVGVAVGSLIVDLAATSHAGLLAGVAADPGRLFATATLEPLLSAGRPVWSRLRRRLVGLLAEGAVERPPPGALLPRSSVTVRAPVTPPDLVDFSSSLHHAERVGRLVRPDAPVADSWRHAPLAYHGRTGSVVVSGTPVRRPVGQSAPAGPGDPPRFGPTGQLDFELELGFLVGLPVPRARLRTGDARRTVFGVVLVNDWSARDLQTWEQRPLGPFLGKSFATSVAGLVTPLDALMPYRVAGPVQEPRPLPYLRTDGDWALDVDLEVDLAPQGEDPTTVTRTNARHLYWTLPQQLAHATVNGATTRSGDLWCTGTVSGPDPEGRACLLELTEGGRSPVTLTDGSPRGFLEDGDTVTLRGRCAPRSGHPRIELAPVAGRILPVGAGR